MIENQRWAANTPVRERVKRPKAPRAGRSERFPAHRSTGLLKLPQTAKQ